MEKADNATISKVACKPWFQQARCAYAAVLMRCATTDQPEGVLSDRDPQELAQVVEHSHGGRSRSSLQEGSYHIEQHKWVEHLHSTT